IAQGVASARAYSAALSRTPALGTKGESLSSVTTNFCSSSWLLHKAVCENLGRSRCVALTRSSLEAAVSYRRGPGTDSLPPSCISCDLSGLAPGCFHRLREG